MPKGGEWERQISKFLTKWLTGKETPYAFWRSNSSGSVWTTSKGLAGESFAGDIRAVTPEAKWVESLLSIEAKNGYVQASLDKHLKQNKNDLLMDFWLQCIEDATESKRLPMLIFKKKGSPAPWVGIIQNMVQQLSPWLVKNNIKSVALHWGTDLEDLYLFNMKEFFEVITPDKLKEVKNIWK